MLKSQFILAKLLVEAADQVEQPVDEEHIKDAYRTSHRRGIVDDKAVVPRYVAKVASKQDTILDFGAGEHISQTKRLREVGFNVTAYDFPQHANPEVHDLGALKRKYDIVFASNVINVSATEAMLRGTLQQIKKAVKRGGKAIFNYPMEPRKWKTPEWPKGVPAKLIAEIVKQVFGTEPTVVHGTNSVPVWEVLV